MRKLTTADNAFLQVESAETPMHVAGVTIFKLPEGVNKKKFMREMLDKLGHYFSNIQPFNLQLKFAPLNLGLPELVPAQGIDLDYHVRHSALPDPGNMDQLSDLVARLHSVLMDLSRPLWEFHLIENLEHNRFAMYFKTHHAVMDGMGAMNLMKSLMSDDPNVTELTPHEPKKRAPKAKESLDLGQRFDKLKNQLTAQIKTATELGGVFKEMGMQALDYQNALVPLWYSAPESPLNVSIQGQRRFAITTIMMEDFKALAKALNVTINDTVLGVCAAALRRYFLEHNNLPQRSLSVCIPVSIRPKDGGSGAGGNAISSLICSLGTTIEDPVERVKHIHKSTKEAKSQLNKMTRETLEAYTILMGMPFIAGQLLKFTQHLPTVFNILISNVPASEKRLYLNGCEMEALYAVNLIFQSQALNITVTSYVDTLDFSFIGCRRTLPDMHLIKEYVQSSFLELCKAAHVKPHKVKHD